MKLKLFLLCLSGVAFITPQDVRRDYILMTTPATWEKAKNYCRSNYEDLAWVQTADNWYRLTAEAERKGLSVTGWIGLYNQVDDWFWLSYGQTTAETMPLDNWVSGQPDNLGGNETCVAMESSGSYSDFTCTELKPSICSTDTTGGFVAVVNPLGSWHQARDYCWTNHLDLAFPIDNVQNQAIHQLVLVIGTAWIGIKRHSWAWTNETEALGIPWRPGHPNNAEYHNDCGAVINSLVEDKVCNNTFNFFCHQKYKTKKQVLRLKILGDNQGFDPATQSAILQKVKKELNDHGLTNEINVTWRVHADGNTV